MEPITLKHPTDPNVTWTSGKRGKRPNWVKDMLAADPTLLPSKEDAASEAPIVAAPESVRYWKWVDQDGKPTKPCIVGAKTPQEAFMSLNRAFKFPVFDTEWKLCWREIDAATVSLNQQEGVFTFNDVTSAWEPRKNVN
jgi:hypothetical protein